MSEWEEQKGVGLWTPGKKGEEFIGKVIKVDKEGTFGIQLIVETENGEMRTPSHKVLQNKISKIKEGDRIKIVYDGQEAATKKGNSPTELYSVFVER